MRKSDRFNCLPIKLIEPTEKSYKPFSQGYLDHAKHSNSNK